MMTTTFRRSAVLLALVAACSDSPTEPTAVDRPADASAVQQVVAGFDATWTTGDFTAYARQFMGAEGWEWVGPTGVVHTDSAAITGLYKTLLTIVFANTSRNSTIRNLTFLTETLAVLDVDTRVTGFASLPPTVVQWQPGVVRVLEKNVLLKRDGTWRIIRHQQTSVAPGVL